MPEKELLRAELKIFSSADVENWETYQPHDPDDFGFSLELGVGLKGEKHFEWFYAQLCTPKWYFKDKTKFEIIFGRHIIFVQEWNYSRLYDRIQQYVNNCRGSTYQEVMEKVGRIAKYEFEDYQS